MRTHRRGSADDGGCDATLLRREAPGPSSFPRATSSLLRGLAVRVPPPLPLLRPPKETREAILCTAVTTAAWTWLGGVVA